MHEELISQQELNASLIEAVRHGHVAAIMQAIQQGAMVNAEVGVSNWDTATTTPLCEAAISGYAASVKILLEAGATVDLKSKSLWGEQTPLHIALQLGHSEIVRFLLAAGADLPLKGNDTDHPDIYDKFIEAARSKGHTKLANRLQSIMDDPANRPTPEEVGLDMSKRIAALEALGKPLGAERAPKAERTGAAANNLRGAEVYDMKKRMSQQELNASLVDAAGNGNVAAIREAIQQGAMVDAEAGVSQQDTALCMAARYGNFAAIDALLQAGADVDGKPHPQRESIVGIPLYAAAIGGYAASVKILLEAGATVDVKSKSLRGERTPLHIASQLGHSEVVRFLLAAGADLPQKGNDINHPDIYDTPMEAARSQGHTKLANYLQSIMDDPANRPSPEEVGLDMSKRIVALEALGKPLGQFTQAERARKAERQAQR